MKNVLMIIPFFPPMAGGGVHRPLGFVRYLEQYGWRPTVVAPQENAFWIGDRTLVDEIPAGCHVHRTRTMSGQAVLSRLRSGREGSQRRSGGRFSWLRGVGAFAMIPDTYIGWYPFARRAVRRLVTSQQFDAIYSTSPPETSHLIALDVHDTYRMPWVADFRDPWMNLYLLPTPTPLHKRLHERLERKVCSRAAVVVTTQWHYKTLQEKYADARLTVIPNGYDHKRLVGLDGVQPADDTFRILHTGMLTQKRTALSFLAALGTFFDDKPDARGRCRVTFLGPRESENDAAARRLGLSDVVEFRDTVSNDETLRLQKRSHVLLLIKHTNSVYDGMVPGKLYEYIGTGRPLLALAPPGEARELVLTLKRGEVASPDDPSEIADGLTTLYEKFEAGRLLADYDLTPRPEFQRERLTGRLAELLDVIAANDRKPHA